MIPNENTKLIARIHSKPNARGLNIYNPFFESEGINAQYLLFYNNTPEKLLKGLLDLGFVGANTAGFENDPEFKKLISNFDESSSFIGHVGYIKNEDGAWKAYYSGGEGLLAAIFNRTGLEGKDIVIVGAGNVSRSLILSITKRGIKPKSITILNRTIEKAKEVALKFNIKIDVKPLEELSKCKGDILINATPLGYKEEDNIYTDDIVKNFNLIVDVTFEIEDTNLIKLARKLKKDHITGLDFFTFQGKVFLEDVLEIEVDPVKLRGHVKRGLSEVI